LISDGFSVILTSRNRIAIPVFGCLMAKSQAISGSPEETLLTVQQTLQTAEETEQH
jgi:hypothetical protein